LRSLPISGAGQSSLEDNAVAARILMARDVPRRERMRLMVATAVREKVCGADPRRKMS